MANPPGNWIEMHGKGPESMIHHIKWWLDILPDAELELIEIVGNRDTLIETWELRGTMQGVLLGQQANQDSIKILGCSVVLFQGDKIKMHKTLLDKYSLMEQIGAL